MSSQEEENLLGRTDIMCMGQSLTKKQQKEAIETLLKGRDYIVVYKVAAKDYKVAAKDDGTFGPPVYGGSDSYRSGCQTTRVKKGCGKEWGWHAFTNRQSALHFKDKQEVVLTCLALPAWIRNVGSHYKYGDTILLRTLCFPQYPRRRVTVAEFRQALADRKKARK